MSVYTFILVLIVLTSVIPVNADDQFLCCMKGIKRIRGVALCPAPCCRGYEEKVVFANKLARITFCVKKKRTKGHRRKKLKQVQ